MTDVASLAQFLDPLNSAPVMQRLRQSWQDRQVEDLLAILTLITDHPNSDVCDWVAESLEAFLAMPQEQQRWLVTIPSMPLWQWMASYIAAGNASPPQMLQDTGFALTDLHRYLLATAITARAPSRIRLKLQGEGRVGFQGTGLSIQATQPVEVAWDGAVLKCVGANSLEEYLPSAPPASVFPWAEPIFNGRLVKVWRHPMLGGKLEIEPRDHYLTQLFEDHTSFVHPAPSVGQAMFGVLETAVSILERVWPEMLEEIYATDKQVLWVENPDRPDEINSFSDNSVPGALYFSMAQTRGLLPPEDVLDSFVHEHLHQKLYLLEASGPLFDPMPGRTFSSPWRTDARPIGGVFHGYFVFYGLRALWTRALAHSGLSTYAQKRVEQIEGQLQVARDILEQNAVFTPGGLSLFALMGETRL